IAEHVCARGFEQGDPGDPREGGVWAGSGPKRGQGGGRANSGPPQSVPPVPRGAKRPAAPRADGAGFAATAKADRGRNLQDKRVRKKVNSASRRRDPSVYT